MGVVGLAGGGEGSVVRTVALRLVEVYFSRRIKDGLHAERRRRVAVAEGRRSSPCRTDQCSSRGGAVVVALVVGWDGDERSASEEFARTCTALLARSITNSGDVSSVSGGKRWSEKRGLKSLYRVTQGRHGVC